MTLIRVIDFETTGFPDSGKPTAICEIGYTDVEVTFGDPIPSAVIANIGEPIAFFCNPGHPMPPEVRAVHHISDADVAAAISPDQGLKRLMDGKPSYFAAHNAKFEQAFFGGGGIPFLCSYKIALRFWPDAPAHNNQTLRYFLELPIDDEALAMPPHRAGPDSYVTAYLIARILEEGKTDIEDLARWSAGPPLLPKIPFGKHFGKKWEDVPTDYLDWIVNKSDMDGDIKANAKHHLKARGVKA